MFKNKVVVVTGGANGIGKAITEEFIANGAKVNIELIKNKLIESGYIKSNSNFDINTLKDLLIKILGIIFFNVLSTTILFVMKKIT